MTLLNLEPYPTTLTALGISSEQVKEENHTVEIGKRSKTFAGHDIVPIFNTLNTCVCTYI
jgi:hypothetical protein